MSREPMPTHPSPVETPAVAAAPWEEMLVRDPRSGLSPAQMVERKLVSLMPSTPLPLSRMQGRNLRRTLA
jgi:hypothetical protein